MSVESHSQVEDREPWITDIHTHLLPARLANKIRAMFESVDSGLQPGPVANGGSCCTPAYGHSAARPSFQDHGPFKLSYPAHHTTEVDAILASSCIRTIWILPYAHKGGGMAGQLNKDIAQISRSSFADSPVKAVAALTVHPEDGPEGVRQTTLDAILQAGSRAAKLHCSVGRYSVLDPALRPFWSLADKARLPVVVHVGSHVSGHTGQDELDQIEGLVNTFSCVPLIIAHSAAPATQRAISLARRYDNVYLDTTPIVTHCIAFPPSDHPLQKTVLDLACRGKILFGSDFPNVVVTLDEQIQHIYSTFADPGWISPRTSRWWLNADEARRAGPAVVEVLADAAARLQAGVRPESVHSVREKI